MNIPKTQYLIIWANFSKNNFTWKMGIFSEPHNMPNNTYDARRKGHPGTEKSANKKTRFLSQWKVVGESVFKSVFT